MKMYDCLLLLRFNKDKVTNTEKSVYKPMYSHRNYIIVRVTVNYSRGVWILAFIDSLYGSLLDLFSASDLWGIGELLACLVEQFTQRNQAAIGMSAFVGELRK